MKNKLTPLSILAFGAIYIIWGSTYLFNKILVQELPPLLLAAIRFLIAGILVIGLSKFFNIEQKPTRQQLKNTAIAGLFFLTIGNGIAVWALQYLDTGLTAILISAQPLVLLVMMRVIDRDKIHLQSLIGIAMGMLGIYLLVSEVPFENNDGQWKGIVGIFFCLLSWGYGSLFVRSADLPANAMLSTGYQMLFGGTMLLLGAVLFREDFTTLAQVSNLAIWSMTYLIIFGSIIAFSSFNYLLKIFSPEKVATNTYVNPIVAMILGAWFLDEKITMLSIIAAGILLSGVYFINSVKKSG